MNQEKCCEKCFGSISGLQWWCNNTDCPCHTSPKEEVGTKEWNYIKDTLSIEITTKEENLTVDNKEVYSSEESTQKSSENCVYKDETIQSLSPKVSECEKKLNRWNFHQVGCDWNRNRAYGSKICDMNCKNVFDGIISSLIKDTEKMVVEEIIKMIKEKGLHLGYANNIISEIKSKYER